MRILSVALLVFLSTEFAFADPFGLETLNARQGSMQDIGTISSGIGYLVFSVGLKTVSLSNVLAFEFFQTTTLLGINPSDNISSTFFYSLADLTDFSAVITGTVPQALA